MDPKRLKIIMTPVGSSGDVHPFVGVGRLLRDRGHEVVVIATGHFGQVVEKAGLGFVPHPESEDAFEHVRQHPDLWHPRRGVGVLLKHIVAPSMRGLYDRIADKYEPGRSVLVGHMLALGTRVFEDKHRVPAVTLSLAPSAFRSLCQVPAHAPGKDLSRLPRWLKRLLWWVVDRTMFDRHIEKPLNAWRSELGLEPVHRIFRGWLHSPRRVIGLFPDWFGSPQPDWPSTARLTGFPLFDETGQHEPDPKLEAFMGRDEPPIVFTPGSANEQASRFFKTAVEAVQQLHWPALLLTRHEPQLPRHLPDHVLYRPYVPLSQVLPRCAAIVHHGGIGTCAQGLAAGVPQLIMPMGYDQPDNATRLGRLGVGAWLEPQEFTDNRLAAALQHLIESSQVAASCRRYADRIKTSDANEQTCDLIEAAANL